MLLLHLPLQLRYSLVCGIQLLLDQLLSCSRGCIFTSKPLTLLLSGCHPCLQLSLLCKLLLAARHCSPVARLYSGFRFLGQVTPGLLR